MNFYIGKSSHKVTVITAMCAKSKKYFGIRMEEKSPRQWYCTDGFSIAKSAANVENYNKSSVHGSFLLDSEFKCPRCGNVSIFNCNKCGKLTCTSETEGYVTCAHCGNGGYLSGSIETLNAGNDF